jgi:surface antigen
MPMHAIRTVTAALAVCLSLWGAPAAAQFGPYLGRNDPLQAEDLRVLGEVVTAVLESGRVGEKRDWSSPASGKHGSVTLVNVFQQDDVPCGTADITVVRGTRTTPTQFRFCRQTDGRWAIVP